MATTRNSRMAGKGSAGQGGDGGTGRVGLKSKLTAVLATVGCVAVIALGGVRAEHAAWVQPPPAPAAVQRPAGTDDLDPNRCIGTAGPFACATGQSLAGTDDFATSCIGTTGPFACAPAAGPADEYLVP